ncbi:MAG: hypothetical protein ACM3S2_19165, partial [Ignavibacteriales bacterium]
MKHLYRFLIFCSFFLLTAFTSYGSDFPISGNTNLDESCAIAYNSTDHEYLVVWSERIPMGNMYLFGAIMGQRLSEEGLLLGKPFAIFPIGMSPAVVYNQKANEFLIVVNNQGLQGQRVSSQGVLTGSSALLMSDAIIPRILYNSISQNYLLLGADINETSAGSGSYN